MKRRGGQGLVCAGCPPRCPAAGRGLVWPPLPRLTGKQGAQGQQASRTQASGAGPVHHQGLHTSPLPDPWATTGLDVLGKEHGP